MLTIRRSRHSRFNPRTIRPPRIVTILDDLRVCAIAGVILAVILMVV